VIFFGLIGVYGIMKALEWAFRPTEEYIWKGETSETGLAYGWNLIISLRGIDWSWGVPKERLPAAESNERIPFMIGIFKRLALWHIIMLVFMTPLCNMRQHGDGSMQNYLRRFGIPEFEGFEFFALLVQAICLGQSAFAGIEFGCALWTFLVFLGQSVLHQFNLVSAFDASRWPTLFNSPWDLSSLNDLWSRRWHALFFRIFIASGLKPGRALFRWTGRKVSLAIGLVCAFAISGLMHEFALWVAQRHLGIDFDWRFTTTRFFLLQAAGIFLEQFYTAITGYKVNGFLGQLWGITWLFATTTFQVAEWMEKGMHSGLPPTSEWQLIRYFTPFATMLPKHILTKS